MIKIPAKVQERISKNLKKYQKIVANAKNNDINEADTITIIKDILSEIMGFDKFSEITSEYAIKKTFCDIAILRDGEPFILLEAKAVGVDLKETHTKQALDYGANYGIDWIILSNASEWKIYKIVFSKPIQTELVYEFCFETLNPRKQTDVEMLFYLTKEAASKSSPKDALEDLREQKQLMSKYLIGQIIITDEVAKVIRRILKKISVSSKVSVEDIKAVLENEVIKRDVFEEEKAPEYRKKVHKALVQK